MKYKKLNYLAFFIYLISSSGSYSIERPDINNLLIHAEKRAIEKIEFFNSKKMRESLENYLYRYYISEATVVSGKKISSNKGSIEDKGKQNEVSNSSKSKKFITAICGEAPNNQRVFLEVIFRAEET